MHLFFAYNLSPAPGGLHFDEDEEIETRVFTRRELERLIRAGTMRDGKTIAAASFLNLGFWRPPR